MEIVVSFDDCHGEGTIIKWATGIFQWLSVTLVKVLLWRPIGQCGLRQLVDKSDLVRVLI